MEMVRGTTDPKLFSATEENLHEFAVNVRPRDLLAPVSNHSIHDLPQHGIPI